ncbi:MAG TPA: chromosomal replication initiator protein DnaA [Candidatus Methylacidiphilales bacterium]|jgi:chromosomal replication initiator protein|nr:chromosomal replication initiator protein DnaA [Candidatus Methylacidiphilales bacterium]
MVSHEPSEQVVSNAAPITEVKEIWDAICLELQQVVSADAVTRWFRPLRVHNFTNKTLTLASDNSIYQYWIEENYLSQLKATASRSLGENVSIVFLPCGDIAAKGAGAKAAITPDAPPKVEPVRVKRESIRTAPASAGEARGTMNPRYTFESFVVGENNRFAHAAAHAVALAPARTYNPLFLHGSVGLGKTHLMQAIGHLILANKKHLRVLYVTSEQFTNEYISAIQHGELAKFRKSYRQVDVLLIDDIQFLAGKDRSQEEFFHTFNALCDGSKQIVLTSDSPPTEIAIEKRLTSRFEMGLTAELQMPDSETRLAILRHKMAAMPEKLTDAVLNFIAERVKTNIRRLEGALNRVAAFAQLHGRPITVPQTEVLLRDLLQQEGQQTVSIDLIQRRVAETYDLRLADMTSKRRPANIALPRMVAMYLSRRLTSASLNEIGEAFGGRDHGTVLHANRVIEERMKGDEKLRRIVTYLSEKLVVTQG